MGLNQVSDKIYLRISYGRVARTVRADTPGAKGREKKDGSMIWELVYESLDGILKNVVFRDDSKFGKSWNVEIEDNGTTYVLQLPEDSRHCTEFLKKLPHLRGGQVVKLKPYDYEKDGKRKVGLIVVADGEKVETYYQKYEEKPDGGWNITELHGFPKFDGDPKDEDELKIYFLKVTKFLREQSQKHLREKFNAEPVTVAPLDIDKDDNLPF